MSNRSWSCSPVRQAGLELLKEETGSDPHLLPHHQPPDNEINPMTGLRSITKLLASPGKGILAADESTPTIEKRINIISTAESRLACRELIFSPSGLGQFISGVILFDETLRRRAVDDTLIPELLKSQGIIAGIKVDKGAKALALFAGEKITEGLDGLHDRFAEYATMGAQFSKWRAVLSIGNDIPTPFCLEANAHALARFAALSQEAGLVPMSNRRC